jgi:hypothetical protein
MWCGSHGMLVELVDAQLVDCTESTDAGRDSSCAGAVWSGRALQPDPTGRHVPFRSGRETSSKTRVELVGLVGHLPTVSAW